MARPTRNDDHAGWFHVMNRGAGRRAVFHADVDRRLFVRLVADASAKFNVEPHAFCLMGNHYHLLVNCPAGGLSSFMQAVGGNYTRAVNERIQSDGPIFRSRFHSLAVSSGEYLGRVGRYIHRNPLDISERAPLARYLWSSYRYYVTAAPKPAWLRTDVLLEMHDGPEGYRQFVEGTQPLAHNSAVVDWAIRTAIVESTDHDFNAPGLERSIAAALLCGHEPALILAAGDLLGHRNPDARRQAVRRAGRRLVTDPAFGALVTRASRLAA
jgi:REP element-mobilizing transposase RayT